MRMTNPGNGADMEHHVGIASSGVAAGVRKLLIL